MQYSKEKDISVFKCLAISDIIQWVSPAPHNPQFHAALLWKNETFISSLVRATSEIRIVLQPGWLYWTSILQSPRSQNCTEMKDFASIPPIHNYLWVSITLQRVDCVGICYRDTFPRECSSLCTPVMCTKINTSILEMCLCFLSPGDPAKLWCCKRW